MKNRFWGLSLFFSWFQEKRRSIMQKPHPFQGRSFARFHYPFIISSISLILATNASPTIFIIASADPIVAYSSNAS